MKIRMTESDNPFNQEFPDAERTQEDSYRKEAFDLLLDRLSDIIVDPEISGQWENEIRVTGTVPVEGTAESAGYEDGSVAGDGEGVRYDLDLHDLAKKVEDIAKEVNEALESAGNPIGFFDPDVDDTGDYEIDEIEDYDVESDDAGIGSYEFWGERGYDSRPYSMAIDISGNGWTAVDIDLEYRKIR